MINGLHNNLLIYQISKHKSNQTTNIKKRKPNSKEKIKLMNNFSDNKGQIYVQGPSIAKRTLLTNHVVTPPPNLSAPNNDCMVMSKLNSLELKEK